MPDQVRSTGSNRSGEHPLNSSRNHILFLLFSIVLFVFAAEPVGELADYSRNGGETAASHLVLIPFVSAFLIFTQRRRVFEKVSISMLPGGIAVAVGLGVLLLHQRLGAALPQTDRLALSAAAIVIVWLGGFILSYGRAAFMAGIFPLLFLAFAIPIPTPVLDSIVFLLQRGSTEAAFVLLKLTGTPVYREGFVFAMPDLIIEVAPECSGIRSGIGMLIVSLLAGHLFLQSWWRRGILVFSSIVIGILKNAIRIDTLSLLTIHVDSGIIDGRLHHEGGAIFFAVGLLLSYPVLLLLMRSERPDGFPRRGFGRATERHESPGF
jgi:exosortase